MRRSLSRRITGFVGVALALAAALLLTWGVQTWRVERVGPDAVREVQADAQEAVRQRLAAVFAQMRAAAERAAADPAVQATLDLPLDSVAATSDAFAAVARLGLGPDEAVEVVAPTGSLVAWAGFSFPRRFRPPPDTLFSRTVQDGSGGRRALALWVPVRDGGRDGGRVVGAVRAVRLAEASVPVRNRYLQDYSLADDWTGGLSVNVDVRFVPSAAPPVPGAAPLRGPDGSLVGWVAVPLTESALRSVIGRSFESVLAVWGVLLGAWLVVGLFALALSALRAADRANTRRRWGRAAGAIAALLGGLVALRYGLLTIDVPVRWLDSGRRPAALFDPSYLASDLGAGLMRSPGDLALTAAFGVLAAGVVLVAALRYAAAAAEGGTRELGRRLVGLAAVAAVAPLAGAVAVAVVRHAVLDATLDYVDQTGPVIDGLTLAVLGALMAVLAAALTVVAATVLVARAGREWSGPRYWVGTAVAALGGAGAVAAFVPGLPALPVVALAALGVGLAAVLDGRPERWAWPLTFRGVLLGTLLLAPVLYATMRAPLDDRLRTDLADAAAAFADARDDRVSFAVDQILADARADDALRPDLLGAIARADSVRRVAGRLAADSSRQTLDSLASGLLTSSLLGSLADIAAEVRLVSPSGDTLGSYVESGTAVRRSVDALSFASMRQAYQDRDEPGFLRLSDPVPGRRGQSRTAAIGPLVGDDSTTAAWVYVRATPRPVRFAVETPFPRVLAPAGLFGLDDEDFTYAEYDDGDLVRSRGAASLRLDPDVYQALSDRAVGLYTTDQVGGAAVRVYYERTGEDARDVVAVRAPADDGLSVLFVLLRLTMAGLAAGGLIYGVGVPLRRRVGLAPARRTRFRDKVLNRFLFVGLASVVLTGLVGRQVIVEQNLQTVQDQLRTRLARAEAVLAVEVAPDGEAPGAAGGALDLPRPDATAAALGTALGVDVHLYRGADLLASSRRQLVRQRLVEPRLPGAVYRALFLDGQPYAFAEDRIGTFRYTTGYRALPDGEGRPVGALAVPTLSEQAAIEAGQARMVAYLFGGLLLLLVAIVVLAALLAGQLTRPFGRLRRGLEAVGAGEAEEPIPVETRDEVGDLVETFNAMQAQLVQSRRRLAEQEREMAWSEMARQVAHEIKNPLMPMKLSVQHLQRIFRPPAEEAPPETRRFAGQFERTTDMLIDQIETLSRIASDFSTFARMPMRNPTELDLGTVAQEAAALFEGPLAESGRAELVLDMAPGPLPVLADHEELRRVLVNLLTNALQAIPERPRAGRITLRTRAEPAAEPGGGPGTALVAVEDDGEGIPDEVRPRVFQPSFSTKTSGMGLGLAISKRAVEAASGTIEFETTEGSGTTFTVRLPLAPPRAPADAPTPSRASPA